MCTYSHKIKSSKTCELLIVLTLFNPTLFGPFNTQEGGGRSAPKLFPELLEGVTCSKMGLKLSSPKNLHKMAQLRYLSHLVREI